MVRVVPVAAIDVQGRSVARGRALGPEEEAELLVEIPVGVTVFPDELYPAPRSWAEKAYPKLIHFNKVDEGGHFAAWEQPLILSDEVRATFRSLR